MHRHIRALVKLLQDTFGSAEICGAEIGVAGGRTSEALLRDLPNLHLTMIDPWVPWKLTRKWERGGERQAAERLAAESRTVFANSRRRIWRMVSLEGAARIEDDSLDFAFIDGDHCYAAVLLDIGAWAGKVKSGGLLVGHDYVDPLPTKYKASRYPHGVKQAVDQCVAERQWDLRRDPATWLWWVQL